MKKVLLTVGFFSLLNIVSQRGLASSVVLDETSAQYQATLRHVSSFVGEVKDHPLINGNLRKWIEIVAQSSLGYFNGTIGPKDYVEAGNAIVRAQATAHTHAKTFLGTPSIKSPRPGKEFGKDFDTRIGEFEVFRRQRDQLASDIEKLEAAAPVCQRAIEDARRDFDEKTAEAKRTDAIASLANTNESLAAKGVNIDAHVRVLEALGSTRTPRQTLDLQQYKDWLSAARIPAFAGNEILFDIAKQQYKAAKDLATASEQALKDAQAAEANRLTRITDERRSLDAQNAQLETLAAQLRFKAGKVLKEISNLKSKDSTPKRLTKIQERITELGNALAALRAGGFELAGTTLEKPTFLGTPVPKEPLSEGMAKEIIALLRK
jgi:hypothetical protein